MMIQRRAGMKIS